MKKRSVWIFIFINGQLFSQPFVDLLNTHFQYFTPVSYLNKAEQMTMAQWETTLKVPIKLNDQNYIIGGLNFDLAELYFTQNNHKQKLYSHSCFLAYRHQWKNNKIHTLWAANTRISADKYLLNKSTAQYGGVILNTIQKNKKICFKFGLYYNKEFFGHFFVPLLGIEWRVKPRIWIYGYLSSGFTFEYKINPKWYVGFANNSIYQSYRVTSTSNYIVNGHTFWANNQIKGFANYYTKYKLVPYIEGGVNLTRRYIEYDKLDTPTNNSYFSQTNNRFFLNIGIAYRLRLDE